MPHHEEAPADEVVNCGILPLLRKPVTISGSNAIFL